MPKNTNRVLSALKNTFLRLGWNSHRKTRPLVFSVKMVIGSRALYFIPPTYFLGPNSLLMDTGDLTVRLRGMGSSPAAVKWAAECVCRGSAVGSQLSGNRSVGIHILKFDTFRHACLVGLPRPSHCCVVTSSEPIFFHSSSMAPVPLKTFQVAVLEHLNSYTFVRPGIFHCSLTPPAASTVSFRL